MAVKPAPDWIRQGRQARGLSQAALARLTGLPQRRLSHWERGLRLPDPADVAAIRAVFDRLDA
ncbi:helix-turn-helix domain-containing protein, partial [Zavarzinia sp.]|uniref:helix-turn-helix domain-containing protein n=1 Tax=Zavarzinia sp. TaxID=2027920 RepID=UPI003BB7D576